MAEIDREQTEKDVCKLRYTFSSGNFLIPEQWFSTCVGLRHLLNGHSYLLLILRLQKKNKTILLFQRTQEGNNRSEYFLHNAFLFEISEFTL